MDGKLRGQLPAARESIARTQTPALDVVGQGTCDLKKRWQITPSFDVQDQRPTATHAATIVKRCEAHWSRQNLTYGSPRIGRSAVYLQAIVNDVRLAIRQHVRKPGFAITVVCTLALTLGATITVFSLVNSIVLRPLPYASPERLVWITSLRSDNPAAPFSLPEFVDYRGRVRSLTGLAAYANWSASLGGDGVSERLQGARVSANGFDLLGVSAAAGRLFVDSDDRPDAPRIVVVSHRVWQRKYGGAADIVGRTVRINGEPFEIVGVLPIHFPLPLRDIDVMTPLAPEADPLRHVRNSVNFLRFFGRLAPGSDAAKAEAELTAIAGALRHQFPVEYARKQAVRVEPLEVPISGDARQSLFFLLAAVATVLATALANLLSLALLRGHERRVELSMRMAAGASRWHLVRQLVADALVLSTAGTFAGWMVATQLLSATIRWAPSSLPRLGELRADSVVALLAVALALVVTGLLSIAPLAALSSVNVSDALRSAGRGTLGHRRNQQLRNLTVIAEIAASVVLMVATAALVQSLLRLQAINPGFDGTSVFHVRLSLPNAFRSPEDIVRLYDELSARLLSVPGVEQVGVISAAPLSGLLATVPFSVVGATDSDRSKPSANIRAISPGYLAAVGTRLLVGRGFSSRDRADTAPVALVSQALAEMALSGQAVGQRILIDDNNTGPRPVEVVGVVENVQHTALDAEPGLDLYIPLAQIHADGVTAIRNNQFWLVKTHSAPNAFRGTFVAALRSVEPDAAVSGAGSMQDVVNAWLAPRRFNLGVFAGFAFTAVLLAMTGLYGLVSYAVSQRAPEIGLRLALGATQQQMQSMVLRQAARLAAIGVALGLAMTVAASSVLATVAPQLRVGVTIALLVVAGLTLVVSLAAWVPARRAARIEPTLALKAE
jgi:predicted permease